MTKEIYISSTPHETRLAVVEDDQLAEIYYERENEYTLAGSVYKGKVTRVLPGMQSAFVDIGLERDAFLYVTDFAEEQEDGEEYVSLPQGNARGNGGRSSRNGHSSSAESGSTNQNLESGLPASDRSVNSSPSGERAESSADEGQQSGSEGRRWRGRRGRRRGRGRLQQELPTTSSLHPTGEGDGVVEESTRFSGDGERSDADASAAEHHSSEHDRLEQEFPDASGPDSRPEETPSRERQGHRHDAQSRSIETGSSQASPNAALVLPGESLSKYGRRPGASASQEPRQKEDHAATGSVESPTTGSNASTGFRPSTMVVAPLTWNGSDDLPGESISGHSHKRHSSHLGQPETARPETSRPEAPQPDRFDSSAAPSSPQPETPAAAAPPEKPEEAAAFADHFATHSVTSGGPIGTEPDSDGGAHSGQEDVEVEATSASYQFDPLAPSHYRQSGAVASAEETNPSADSPEAPYEAIPQTGAEVEPEPEQDFRAEPDQEPESEDREHDPHVFDPGRGDLEEEMIEEGEEDTSPSPTFAADESFDELIEETLDAQMDSGLIGEVVRDQHIDRRTGFRRDPAGELPAEESLEEPNGESEEEFAEAEGRDATGVEEMPDETLDEADEESDEEAEPIEESHPDRVRSTAPRPNRRGVRGRRQGPGDRHRMRRSTAQTTNLPAITELLKPNQEILVQIAKEPIARKGARITSHIALPGRFLVFMPTVNHVGVSRKISSDEERQRLKRILLSEKGDAPGGFIVRTAAATANEDDLRADIRFLLTLWSEIRQRADSSKPPALIYHDLSLVERVLRDRVTEQFSAVWVDSEQDYERVLRFLNRFEPALVRRVKLYTKETPLFEQFGLQEEINKALRSKVWLKSGGSIVINQTEALVAIDINTGKYVGKTARLEDTILKTNLDAIPEIVRQIRLRDLGGIIVIDFIDMDERRNRNKVMQALEEALKSDRAPSKVLQFNDFGLVAITRKRVKQSLERTLSVPCFTCTGTGMVKGPVTVCNEIYVELRKMHRQIERGDILLRVNPEVVKQLKASNGRWLSDMEELTGKTVIVKSDAALPPDQFDIH